MMIDNDFNSIIELLNTFPDQDSCIKHLEAIRWGGNVISPFDEESTVYKCKNHQYKCKTTGKYFNVKTDTLFGSSNIGLQKWFLAIWLITSHKKGISSTQLAKDIRVTQKTAWFMLQRIRNCFGVGESDKLKNTVEVDETYMGGKNSNKQKSKRLVFKYRDPSYKNPSPQQGLVSVHGAVERGGKVAVSILRDATKKELARLITDRIDKKATIYTDQKRAYMKILKNHIHSVIQHNDEEYVRGDVHTNTIEGFWSLLKRSYHGIYHWWSPKHSKRYIDEAAFRYNNRDISEGDRFNAMLSDSCYRTRYQDLITT